MMKGFGRNNFLFLVVITVASVCVLPSVINILSPSSSSSSFFTSTSSSVIKQHRHNESSIGGSNETAVVFETISENNNIDKNEATTGVPFDSNNTSEEEEAIVKTSNATTTATIVCQLSGEMGNNIGKYAQCYALSLWLLREYQLPTKIVLRHQNRGKWIRASADVQQCFPNLQTLDFEEGNTEEFDRKFRLQLDSFGSLFGSSSSTEVFGDVNSRDSLVVQHALNKFVNHTQQPFQTRYSNETISIPFLYSDFIVSLDFYSDRYMDDFRQIFAFDDHEACCRLKPDPDESVFHLRNFLIEMPKRGKTLGFEEMGPEQVARDLFGHLTVGDKVAIVSRFSEDQAQPYITALRNRGLQVRYVSNQTGVQDFCFLRSAQKEMVGFVRSTFFLWAGFLAPNCSRVVAYSLDTPEQRNRNDGSLFGHYHFTHPDLQKRFVFQLFRPDTAANITTANTTLTAR